MPKIDTIYVANHTHHDIGFNDHQEVCFRQHGEFVTRALDLIEATADRPEPERYRWTCELTGPLLRHLRGAGRADAERFRHWQRLGAIDVGAMNYNLTPLLGPEQMHRSLYPVRVLREEYGISVETAMQCDVNGVSWLFADLLPAIGVDFLTMALNQSRGRAPRPFPGGFWWQGPAGGRILTWNGFHYLFGRSQAKLGDRRFVDGSLPAYLERLEAADDYPFDFLYAQSTHPMRVDNGPPDLRMADFVRRWNEEGRTPRIEFTTPRAFREVLKERWADGLPTWRGDWTDWWADGVASSAYETGVNRGSQELIGAAETLGAWLRAEGRGEWDEALLERIYESLTLFDEHTWGAFSSIDAPSSLFTRAQWNRKAGFAYEGAMLTHDLLARTARDFAATRAEPGPEGMFNLGDLDPAEAYPRLAGSELLIVNTLPFDREAIVEVPEHRGGGAPAGMLEGFFPRGVPWGGPPPSALARVRARVPGLGYAFVDPEAGIDQDDLRAEGTVIENAHYRVEIDPATGTVASWVDKALGHDFAGEHEGRRIGEYVHETVADERGRDALYLQDFASWDFGYWQADPPLRRAGAREVTVHPAEAEHGRAVVEVDVSAPGVRSARCVFALESRVKALHVDWLLDKEPHTDPESVYIAFPIGLDPDGFGFLLDLNGVPCAPNDDQLPGVSFDWYPIRRWADVSDDRHGVTVVPLDAPLVQLGGITTGKIAERLEPESPTIMSWALNNHWMVNFRAAQEGEVPLRFRLTTHAGPGDPVAAGRFAAEASTPPIVLRDQRRFGAASGRFAEVPEGLGVETSIKPAGDGDGVIVRLRGTGPDPVTVPLRLAVPAGSVLEVSPLEENGAALPLDGDTVTVDLGRHQTRTLRIRP
ncbi:glycoside hydrolase family 38 N-terminal domain-containing protein [Spongiactinospora rosea]|nr:glycoside hydrolase family 38 C-terminal domain-containing protein [Spongiactinospora rosea]